MSKDSPTEGLLRIGEVAKLFKLSLGTLRHYEHLGLLEPAYVDPANGYRYYGVRQLSNLNTISHMRTFDLPLAQIKEFVTTRDVALMEHQLAEQQELIARKQRELEQVAHKIDSRLGVLHEAIAAKLDVICEIDAPRLRCAVLREQVRPVGAYDLEWQIRRLQQHQDETLVFMGNLGVGIDAERLQNRDFSGYDQVFLILDESDSYRGTVETWPATRCATVYFNGTHGQAGTRYEMLLNYMQRHNLRPAGPSREIALIDDVISDDPTTFVTKIMIPITSH